MRNGGGKTIAIGGVLAALAVVVMSLGTLVPGCTYICPILCLLMTLLVLKVCGEKMAWTWYAAVAILAALLSPDKEAAGVFLVLGYYPILKPRLDKSRLRWLWKLLLFNGAVIALYAILIGLLGLEAEGNSRTAQSILLGVLLLLGNAVFMVTDLLLGVLEKRFFRGRE